ncbi:putative long-chain fatty-acid-CoA ligase [Bacillus sp. OxB-1]|uniref:AMP-binding protein n=1 Tax=Bacillus sp. (strain OxB-1) TaxID=98228 RepID=UPI000581DB21|nr:AMP-binding protein [Bacillus sp. OxB-1]BAQ11072.1 putative long-chain fatty-acid-CoA ligase [Bacillus sp. OxB-1]
MFHEQGWIVKRAALSPYQTALIDLESGRSWTYEQLKQRIVRWASYLTDKGFRKGDRIAVLAHNTSELIAILFACEMKGLIYVPLNFRLHPLELQQLIHDCQPALLLFDNRNAETAKSLCVDRMEYLNVLDSYEEQSTNLLRETYPSDVPWMMIYTGGTTGASKGVVLPSNAVNWNAINTIISWGLTETDCTINYMPLFHTGGINALCLPILMAGGTVVIGSTFNAKEALQATNVYQATISLFVPTMYQSIIQTEYFQENDFPSMNVFLSGGAPCPASIYLAFRKKGLRFKEGYGLTEAGPNNFFIRPEEAEHKVGSVGKSMVFNEVNIVANGGASCGFGEVGELQIRGPHLFSHYWNKPLETAEALQNGWLRTGDLARMDEDGDFYIVGRQKEMIISGGENIYPLEIEQCLVLFEGVGEVAVIGVEDMLWGEKVVAFFTRLEGYDVTEQQIAEHCKKSLGTFKVPKEFIHLKELPKTHVGKIDKQALHQELNNRVKVNKKA